MQSKQRVMIMEKEYTEHDWKLFRSRIAKWQERYMERLIREYIDILEKDGAASKRFWALEKRIHNDKRKAGVTVELRHSRLVENMVSLYHEGAITDSDLEGFSDQLVEKVTRFDQMR